MAGFLDPERTPEKSLSLNLSSIEKTEAQKTMAVVRGFDLSQLPAEMVMEHYHPALHQEMEEEETDLIVPLIAEEMQTLKTVQQPVASS